MSIESHAPCAQPAAPPAYCPPPVTDLPLPDPAPPLAADRRLLLTRGLEARLAAQACTLHTLQETLASLRQDTGDRLRELYQHKSSLTTGLLRQGAQLARQRRELEASLQARTLALDHCLQPLQTTVAATTADLQRQQAQLQQLQDMLAALALRLAAQTQRRSTRLRRLGQWLSVVALLCLGGSAWRQLHAGELARQASQQLAPAALPTVAAQQ